MPKPNLTVLGDVSSIGKPHATYYSRAGLVWAAQKVQKIRLKPASVLNGQSKSCNVCEKFETLTNRAEFRHQPGLIALNASASAGCQMCIILLASLEGHRPLDTWTDSAKGLSLEDSDDDDNDSLTAKIERGQHEPDEIIVFELTVADSVDPIQRFRAVWRKEGVVGFNFPGDIVGFAQLRDQGPAARLVWNGTNGEDWTVRFDTLQELMKRCDSQHPHCSGQDDKFLPTRVIDLEAQEASDTVRLITVAGHVGVYAALSYCWGGNRVGITTQETLAANLQCINLKDLPRTFRDAITITKRLGIRFLWIDALCIVQDDQDDWQQESARMQKIFSNASVTLAAASATNCDGGLLLSFVPALHAYKSDNNDLTERIACRLGHIHSRPPPLPLHTRGWTLQEVCLSQRVLHFTYRQVIWQCASTVSSEDGILDSTGELQDSFPPILNSLDIHGQLSRTQWYSQWERLVEIFSERQLTFERDKIPAFAGIISFFRDKLADEQLVGIWRDNLANDLLWKSWGGSPSRLLPKLPSWSWLATSHPIKYNRI